ncbi:KGG domain-containing protein [Microcoleus sp. S36b_A3]|uniref:KGG domain-containing protein n=2 Tax=Microcoleaceae TaxID=1892252 RepID=UPI002FD31918
MGGEGAIELKNQKKHKETVMAEKSKRGFASMDAEKQRAIASKGGKAAHAKGTAHEFTSEEARQAGQKGGEAVSRNREHMAQIGREGGKKSRKSES